MLILYFVQSMTVFLSMLTLISYYDNFICEYLQLYLNLCIHKCLCVLLLKV